MPKRKKIFSDLKAIKKEVWFSMTQSVNTRADSLIRKKPLNIFIEKN